MASDAHNFIIIKSFKNSKVVAMAKVTPAAALGEILSVTVAILRLPRVLRETVLASGTFNFLLGKSLTSRFPSFKYPTQVCFCFDFGLDVAWHAYI